MTQTQTHYVTKWTVTLAAPEAEFDDLIEVICEPVHARALAASVESAEGGWRDAAQATMQGHLVDLMGKYLEQHPDGHDSHIEVQTVETITDDGEYIEFTVDMSPELAEFLAVSLQEIYQVTEPDSMGHELLRQQLHVGFLTDLIVDGADYYNVEAPTKGETLLFGYENMSDPFYK